MDDTTTRLRALYEEHVWRVNDALTSGCSDADVQRIADQYPDEALRLLTHAA